jgi:protein tyrosine phosphatase
LNSRDPALEYKVLTRINCHKQKYDKLFKSFQGNFKGLNKYPDILPFENNRVMLGKPKDPVVFGLNPDTSVKSNISQSS